LPALGPSGSRQTDILEAFSDLRMQICLRRAEDRPESVAYPYMLPGFLLCRDGAVGAVFIASAIRPPKNAAVIGSGINRDSRAIAESEEQLRVKGTVGCGRGLRGGKRVFDPGQFFAALLFFSERKQGKPLLGRYSTVFPAIACFNTIIAAPRFPAAAFLPAWRKQDHSCPGTSRAPALPARCRPEKC